MKIIRYEKENICGNFCTEKWPTEKSKRIYTFIVLFVQAFIPFSIMAVSYHQIFAFLRQRAHNRLTSIAQQANMLYLLAATAGGETSQHKEQLGHLIDQKNRLIRQKRRVTLILCLMVVLFGLTSLPHNIVSVITEFDNEYEIFILEDGTDITYLASLFSHFVAMTSCVINPILYGMLNPEFRDVIVKNLKWAPRFVSNIPTQISAIGATQV
uniref:G-protein coupled receptors family 1 profile domain-containing protein n=1 Tax=Panagrolaimus sp. JU765 TaxID=591449 RepID=A0AC34R5X5_9BILA